MWDSPRGSTGIERRLKITTPDQWRAWLEKNHAVKEEAWLTIYSKHSAAAGLRLEAAVEEALCFGWIDGLLRRLDGEKYALRFSPRKPGGVWAETKKRRVKRLIAEGRMTAAGLDAIRRAKKNREWRDASLRADTTRLPADLKKALAANPKARRNFAGLAPSHRKQFLWWITSAKKPETRSRRIRETVRLAAANKKPA